jgi:hypothetical protein
MLALLSSLLKVYTGPQGGAESAGHTPAPHAFRRGYRRSHKRLLSGRVAGMRHDLPSH